MILRILNILVIVVPIVVEWFRKQRDQEETPQEYVHRKQKELIETYEAMLKDSGKLSRIRRTRLAVLKRMRKSNESTGRSKSVPFEGTELQDDPAAISMQPTSKRD